MSYAWRVAVRTFVAFVVVGLLGAASRCAFAEEVLVCPTGAVPGNSFEACPATVPTDAAVVADADLIMICVGGSGGPGNCTTLGGVPQWGEAVSATAGTLIYSATDDAYEAIESVEGFGTGFGGGSDGGDDGGTGAGYLIPGLTLEDAGRVFSKIALLWALCYGGLMLKRAINK